jgi:hypothetical protein
VFVTYPADRSVSQADIGTAPNEIPLNQYLGSLAYQNLESVVVGDLQAGGSVVLSAGSVSAPAITTVGDTNTGVFFPAADTIAFSEGGSEAMRIDSSGNLLVGTTSATDIFNGSSVNEGIALLGDKSIAVQRSASAGIFVSKATGYTSGQLISFRVEGSTVGLISTNGTTTSYGTSSDYRLKEDAHPMVDSINRLMALNPVNFAWKVDGSRVDGFLAHEAQEVVPEAVTGTKDAVDDEGNPDYQAIDQSKLVPLLTAALQDAVKRIEALEAQLQGN